MITLGKVYQGFGCVAALCFLTQTWTSHILFQRTALCVGEVRHKSTAALANFSKQLRFCGVQGQSKVKGIFQLFNEVSLWRLYRKKENSQKKGSKSMTTSITYITI